MTELRLPSASEHTPQLRLLSYHGPELSEWEVSWGPPSTQASGSITLQGRKFGVSFTIVMSVGALWLKGGLRG